MPAVKETTPPRPPTAADTLLVVAASLPPTFTAADLTVAAWKADPDRFGMPNGHNYPDSHRVSCSLLSTKGIVGAGLLERVARSTYRLTDAGRVAVARLGVGMPARLPRHEDVAGLWRELAAVTRTEAFSAYRDKIELPAAWPAGLDAARVKAAAEAAVKYMLARHLVVLPLAGREPIPFADVAGEGGVLDYLHALGVRFGGINS